jgi:hypothetical protein
MRRILPQIFKTIVLIIREIYRKYSEAKKFFSQKSEIARVNMKTEGHGK